MTRFHNGNVSNETSVAKITCMSEKYELLIQATDRMCGLTVMPAIALDLVTPERGIVPSRHRVAPRNGLRLDPRLAQMTKSYY